ncbi:hypothetical protein M9H77_08939 [Catharanthus roseus]|uniref:Uncharacterized protein n=1 Tax=Catharanthus roseus TaxID=4058 RepID=A0ACC0BZ67_CATRO|nr:hypothetical protein M9H77_08939 [Catharanthus roseus]
MSSKIISRSISHLVLTIQRYLSQTLSKKCKYYFKRVVCTRGHGVVRKLKLVPQTSTGICCQRSASQRFCLRHILTNLNKTFKNTKLKSLMWQAEMESKQWKFDRVMCEIQKKNVDAYIYLVKIDLDKWTLLHDGGNRHGIMTTNISEALNSVLKKARVLPLKALVELIFNKLVRYFNQHREEAQKYVHLFPTRIFDKFLRIELKSRDHKVTTYNPREGIYMVRSLIYVDSTGNNVYTLRVNNKSCSCGKWQAYTLPCSHAFVVCRENGTRANTYMPDIYSRETYKRTYQLNFHPVRHENIWRDAPYNLTFHSPNMTMDGVGNRAQDFGGKWIIEIRILPQDVADVVCWHIIEKIVITPVQAMYKFLFLKVL